MARQGLRQRCQKPCGISDHPLHALVNGKRNGGHNSSAILLGLQRVGPAEHGLDVTVGNEIRGNVISKIAFLLLKAAESL